MNTTKKLKLGIMASALLVLTSCDPFEPEPDPTINYSNGVWMVNEGGFGQNNGSISVYYNGARYSDPFFEANGTTAGDILQRVIRSGSLFVAVNNGGNKVSVGNSSTMKVQYEITGLDYPRDVVVNGDFLYIAQGAMNGKVGKYQLSNGAWISDVVVGNGPERLLVVNNQLWVANSGGWLTDNTISVIDLTTFQLTATLYTGDRPSDLVYESQSGRVFALGSGETLYDGNWNVIGHTMATLSGFESDLSSFGQIQVGVDGDHPRFMDVLNGEILVVNGGLDAYTNTSDLICNDCISGSFYSVDADETGNVWLTSVPDYVSNSNVYQYNWSNRTLKKSYQGGIATHSVIVP